MFGKKVAKEYEQGETTSLTDTDTDADQIWNLQGTNSTLGSFEPDNVTM